VSPGPLEFHGVTNMQNPRITEFAKTLIEVVRDSAIQGCDMNIRQDTTYPAALRWKAALNNAPKEVVSVIVPDCVDETIYRLLSAIDDGSLPISIRTAEGELIDLHQIGKGELAGWYLGSGGWRAVYSEERFADDFSDLTKT